MVLVVGATGFLGMEICRKLTRGGTKVRAFVRRTSDESKIELLRTLGAELAVGDLKDPATIASACQGVDAIISTASSTFSRQEGDSIESVDGAGQLALVEAARAAEIERFIFVSFRHSSELPFPLAAAKANVEQAISGMKFTVIQASFFMESWLSPAVGFDIANRTARIYGSGQSAISWVSGIDVAEMCVRAYSSPDTAGKIIPFGGPRGLTALEVVDIFQKQTNEQWKLEYVPSDVLLAQFQAAKDPMEKTFAALMLGAAYGDDIPVDPIVKRLGIQLTSVEEFAARSI